jgi:hypothetical protein
MVLDDLDPTADEYREAYPDVEIEVFDKMAEFEDMDRMANHDEHGAIVYARNASFAIAKRLGLAAFVQLDDDYRGFDYRVASDGTYKTGAARDLDGAFEAMVDYLFAAPVDCVAFLQAGDWMGGGGSWAMQRGKRKVMNSQFCRTDRPFKFLGHINEDVNTYLEAGGRGAVMLSICPLTVVQTVTQSKPGGMSEEYARAGTYVKSFTSVIARPDCVKVSVLGFLHPRIHHGIRWDYAVPKIVSEATRKL